VAHAEEGDSLIDGARRGDEAAWASLYREAYGRLVAFAHHRLGGAEEARDAVSETMTRAVAQIDRYRGTDDGFTPWLFGILRHVVADTYRRRRRHERPLAPDLSLVPDPADALVEGADRALIRDSFARLAPDEQEVLALRVVAGLSSEEVALVIGRTPSAIRMAQMRALGKLRTLVEGAERVG
jgi:RNA polymerase sigma-70 factor (ECF subfamily)